MNKILSLILSAAAALSFCCCTSACSPKDGGTLVMATDADFPPFEYKDDNGDIVGFDIEVAEAIAEKLGMTLKIENIPFSEIISKVENGSCDFGMAGLTVNEERKAHVMFSDTYATGIQSIIVRQNSEYNELSDFFAGFDESGNPITAKINITVGVQKGTTGDTYASADPVDWGFDEKNVKKYATGEEAVQALAIGELTAVIIDNEPAKAFAEKYPSLRILDAPYANESYAVCVSKENTELLGKINNALEALDDEGRLEEIYNKYIAR
ncbi:MAG: ABC transporter substrate-binding protein [Bacteroides sp.]|nr:ABC transporter substrate-binding protein [Bacteroides sp.]